MRAALYHRVSTVDQRPELARLELRAAAQRLGYTVTLDLEEVASGARSDRPKLLELLAAARRGDVGAVLVWKLDRFGRSTLDLLHNIHELERRGVRFHCTEQGLDIRPGGDPVSRLLLTMLAGVAEFERTLIAERTRLGLEAARRAGKVLGRPLAASTPSRTVIACLRAQGRSWRAIGAELGCPPSTARRVLARATKGGSVSGGQLDGEAAPF